MLISLGSELYHIYPQFEICFESPCCPDFPLPLMLLPLEFIIQAQGFMLADSLAWNVHPSVTGMTIFSSLSNLRLHVTFPMIKIVIFYF